MVTPTVITTLPSSLLFCVLALFFRINFIFPQWHISAFSSNLFSSASQVIFTDSWVPPLQFPSQRQSLDTHRSFHPPSLLASLWVCESAYYRAYHLAFSRFVLLCLYFFPLCMRFPRFLLQFVQRTWYQYVSDTYLRPFHLYSCLNCMISYSCMYFLLKAFFHSRVTRACTCGHGLDDGDEFMWEHNNIGYHTACAYLVDDFALSPPCHS